MANAKDILVVTTPSTDGLKIIKHLKPVSSHIVAGTNLFSDFLGGLTDVFGGRSISYQNELHSLYNEAIEQIKKNAYELGANCVIGMSIDIDEISGKGKSMFMITAIGTAVIIEKEAIPKNPLNTNSEKLKDVSAERINILRTKKIIITKANNDSLTLNDDVWNFITENQIDEVFAFLLERFSYLLIKKETSTGSVSNFRIKLISYIDSLPDDIKLDLLYNYIQFGDDENIVFQLIGIIDELKLFDFTRVMNLLNSDQFQTRKKGLLISKSDKSFYNKDDIKNLLVLKKNIGELFIERGTRSLKKQLVSTKEIWICECGKSNDMGNYCSNVNCKNDIVGFKLDEEKPISIENYIDEKIKLIEEFLE